MQHQIQTALRHFGLTVSAETSGRLAQFAGLVSAWNRRLDLTAARDGGPLVEVLFADAAVLADPEVVPLDARLIDVGAGAGAPALPLLILRPDLQICLLEPLQKRVAFLRTCVGELGLVGRCTVIGGKLDLTSPSSVWGAAGANASMAMSRATFAPEIWLPAGLALAPRVAVLTASPFAVPADEAALLVSRRYRLPFSGASRELSVFGTAAGGV